MMYTEAQLVRIAKRENNLKRNYLVVNRLQGKHIPVKPSEAFGMFGQLAAQVSDSYPNERLCVIGFAETATAIGAAVAHRCGALYMHTTREKVPGADFLFFSEEHSHAAEQRLVKDDVEKYAAEIDRAVFVEDEVTTGKTLINIIDILEKNYPEIQKYAVASLLNGMGEESLRLFGERDIPLHYLVKTDQGHYSLKAEGYRCDGAYYENISGEGASAGGFVQISFPSRIQARRCTAIQDYDAEISRLWDIIQNHIAYSAPMKVLVLGTEEFMYPALRIAEKIECLGCDVRSHSTTRSPASVSTEADYPLHERYALRSLYDSSRRTYLYDIGKYDSVLIVTDAPERETEGLNCLIAALGMKGNDKIYVVRWCS